VAIIKVYRNLLLRTEAKQPKEKLRKYTFGFWKRALRASQKIGCGVIIGGSTRSNSRFDIFLTFDSCGLS
jgi:hypothetical protein